MSTCAADFIARARLEVAGLLVLIRVKLALRMQMVASPRFQRQVGRGDVLGIGRRRQVRQSLMHVAIRVFFASEALLVRDGRTLAVLLSENLATANRFLTLCRGWRRLAHFEIAGACGCLKFVAIVFLKSKALVQWLLMGWIGDLADLGSYLIALG